MAGKKTLQSRALKARLMANSEFIPARRHVGPAGAEVLIINDMPAAADGHVAAYERWYIARGQVRLGTAGCATVAVDMPVLVHGSIQHVNGVRGGIATGCSTCGVESSAHNEWRGWGSVCNGRVIVDM